MTQGYMMNQKAQVIRVRLAGEQAWLTIKGETVNSVRKEFEYTVPPEDARELLDLFCDRPLMRWWTKGCPSPRPTRPQALCSAV